MGSFCSVGAVRKHRLRRGGFLLLALALGAAGIWWQTHRARQEERAREAESISERARRQFDTRAAWLEAREARAAATWWAAEKLAQACGHVFDDLWDALNAASNKWAVALRFPVEELRLGRWEAPRRLAHGILLTESAGPGPVLNLAGWKRLVREQERAGWRLMQVEFRHTRFDTNAAGQPRQSTFYFSAHLTNAAAPQRAELVGDLFVDWQPTGDTNRPARVARVDASRLTLKTRAGAPPFERVLDEEIPPPEPRFPIDPVLVRDLDGDGLPEIALPGVNRLYRRAGPDRYQAGPLCAEEPGPLFTALIEDFTGDGAPDLLVVNALGLLLFPGSVAASGILTDVEGDGLPPETQSPDATQFPHSPTTAAELGSPALRQPGKPAATGVRPAPPFRHPPQQVWLAGVPLKNPMALTCGDVDGDGDLDVFFAQYRVPTLGTVLKPAYHDANDGDPAYLLLNNGAGRFSDATAAAGLAAKRWRRTYSASLVDLDADGPLDLLVVSDFAGAEVYRNDGRGRFTEVTEAWLGDAKGFGMAHTFADFNADGRLDFLMIGMPSPTVDRLNHLGLGRPGPAEDPAMRERMACGNRLFLARPEGGFVRVADRDAITRSGWSWGAAAADFDLDGRPDVYIANGHQSTRSVREYEPDFWLHDLYVDDSIEAHVAGAYLFRKFDRTRGRGWSYGGYEKNRLYLNQGGAGFVEAGHLLGVALEADSRNVVAEDLDGDGASDLLVTTFEVWPRERQTLQIYRNRLAERGNWIGFRAAGPGRGDLPVGTRITVRAGDRRWVRAVVNGDSHRCQHSGRLHFGLGPTGTVEEVEVRWPDGRVAVLREPEVNRYHILRRPGSGSGQAG